MQQTLEICFMVVQPQKIPVFCITCVRKFLLIFYAFFQERSSYSDQNEDAAPQDIGVDSVEVNVTEFVCGSPKSGNETEVRPWR
jgi:hypothetical protein